MKLLSRVQLFATLWTAAYQVLPSMGFSRQEYWSGLPFPSPGDLPNPEIPPVMQETPAGDMGSIPVLERSPEEGNGDPFQYSCLENPMDGGAW